MRAWAGSAYPRPFLPVPPPLTLCAASAEGARAMFPEKQAICRRSTRGSHPIVAETQPLGRNAPFPSPPSVPPTYLWKDLPRWTSSQDNVIQINTTVALEQTCICIECWQTDGIHKMRGIRPLCQRSQATFGPTLVLVREILD